ncbi:hypothetical protein [Actinomyces trachealis]|uniref:hypothetical protein n=1 Tax=Actinomyces trachealis TaxID=2763540 RepID=UPI001F33AF21|nr:hypothetical protein [Actinomyces trachealis]
MTSRRGFIGASSLLAAAVLAACSEKAPHVAAPSGEPTVNPVLDSERLVTVLERIQKGADAADATKDPKALTGYLTGPAARVRAESYTLATTVADDKRVRVLKTTSQASAVGLTQDFPRTAITVTEGTDTSNVPLLLALTQEDARSDYQLWGWVQVFGGATFPKTATAASGSKQITADDASLAATPQAVLDAYVDALNNPQGTNGTAFADDQLRQQVARDRATDVSAAGEVTVQAAAGSDGFQGLATSDGGAVVITTLTVTTTFKRTTAGSKLTLSSDIGIMLGDNKEVVGTVTATYDAMVAFSIPAAGGGQATTLGAEVVLAKVERDDSQAPSPAPSASASAAAKN